MTRAFVQLAQGHWDAALRAQPLVLLLIVETVVAWAWWGLVLAGRASPPGPRLQKNLLRANLAILAGAWIVRLLAGTLP
jgi:hypothetical protein